MIGEAAGVVARLAALHYKGNVHHVPYARVRSELIQENTILNWPQ